VRTNPRLGQLPTYPTVAIDRVRDRLLAAGRPVYDFGTGDPIEPTPGFIRDRLCASIPDNCRYPTVAGEPAVRTAFAGYARRRLGVTLDPATEILPTSGSKEAVFHLPLLVIDPTADDRAVVFPDPGYSVYYRGTVLAGGEPVPQRLGGDFVQRIWELPREVLRRTRMVWINTPHNPCGAVMAEADLRRTWEVCREHDILLVSDECYVDTWFDTPPPSILNVAREGVLAIFSLSKRSGMTGYRSGIVAGDPVVMKALRELRANPGLAAQDFVNAAAAAAWEDDAHAEARRHIFAAKRAVLLDFLHEAGLEVVASEASFYLWVRAPGGRTGMAYAEELLQAGILTYPGSAFAVTGAGDPYVRLALVPDLATCRAAVEAWRGIL
jgi:succinyldiaminopimelate transaminase